MSQSTAQTVIAVSVLVMAICSVAAIAATGMAIFLISKRIRELTKSFRPPIAEATEALKAAKETAETMRDAAADLSEHTKRTAAVVEDAISTPLMAFSSLLAGLCKGLESLRQRHTDE